MPGTMYDDEDEDDVVDVSRHDAPPPGQTEGQHQQAQAAASGADREVDDGPPLVLKAEWDKAGRCWVALHQGDKQVENWRDPSKDEWDALRARGNLVRSAGGGPIGASAAGETLLGKLLDTAKKNAVPFAIGGAVVYGILQVLAASADGKKGKRKKAASPDDAGDDDAADDTVDDDAAELDLAEAEG